MLSPCPAPFNLTAHVLARADALGDKPALSVLHREGAGTLGFAALKAAVLGTASGLLGLGLAPGDRILMRLGNTVDFPILYLAALAVDLVPVPTSSQLTVPEITAMAALIRPALVVATPGVALPDPAGRTLGIDALRAMRNLPPARFAMGDPNRPGYIVFSSGTSGKARGVVHAHRAIWARRTMIDGWYGLTSGDRMLHAGAFNWTYTLGTGLLDPWAIGATALIAGTDIAPGDLAPLLARHGATIFAAAPGVYRQMLRHEMPAMPALRHGLSAGEKLPEATRDAWATATGAPIFEAYGMSECSTFLSGSPAAPAPAGTLGRAQPGRQIAILGDDGPCPTGQPGTIAIAHDDPGLMLGYLEAPGATAQKYRDGWFLTGDTGVMDATGAVTYLGRADDMMNAGGYRVSPIEVEQVLATFPGLQEAAVIETRVKADTTVIAALYTAAAPLDHGALAAHCAAQLARYKCPRLFARIETLPRGANNKVLRRALRDSFRAPDRSTT